MCILHRNSAYSKTYRIKCLFRWRESLQIRIHQYLMWRIYVSKKCTENSENKLHCQSCWQKKNTSDVTPGRTSQKLLPSEAILTDTAMKNHHPRQREFRISSSASPHQYFSIACLLLAFVAWVQKWCRLDLLLLHMSIKSFRRVARLFPLCPRTVQRISYPIWTHSDNSGDGCMLNTSLAMLSSISHWCLST